MAQAKKKMGRKERAQKAARARWEKYYTSLPKYTIKQLKEINAQRSERSRTLDSRRTAKIVLSPKDPRVALWVKHPDRYDIEGIDTMTVKPKKAKDRKAPKKAEKPVGKKTKPTTKSRSKKKTTEIKSPVQKSKKEKGGRKKSSKKSYVILPPDEKEVVLKHIVDAKLRLTKMKSKLESYKTIEVYENGKRVKKPFELARKLIKEIDRASSRLDKYHNKVKKGKLTTEDFDALEADLLWTDTLPELVENTIREAGEVEWEAPVDTIMDEGIPAEAIWA